MPGTRGVVPSHTAAGGMSAADVVPRTIVSPVAPLAALLWGGRLMIVLGLVGRLLLVRVSAYDVRMFEPHSGGYVNTVMALDIYHLFHSDNRIANSIHAHMCVT